MRTDELIIELARSVQPVHPLAPPLARMTRWMAAALPVAALGALAIGVRADVRALAYAPALLPLGAAPLVMTLFAAAAAFVLSVPGAERTPLMRALPIAAGVGWAGAWIVRLTSESDAMAHLAQMDVHVSCGLEIVVFGLAAGWPLVAMLRRAAPLHHNWSAALASLAAAGLGATATHFICPVDDAGHQLVSHVAVVMLASLIGTLAARRSLKLALDGFREARTGRARRAAIPR